MGQPRAHIHTNHRVEERTPSCLLGRFRLLACKSKKRYSAMKKLPLRLSEKRKRAVVDTVRSILECKGRDIVSISPSATVHEAIAEMAEREIGALLVVS